MSRLDRLAGRAGTLLRAALLVTLTGWVLDVPGMLGRYYYVEQFLALVAGFSCALVLVEQRASQQPVQP